jgi:hypothetical protein
MDFKGFRLGNILDLVSWKRVKVSWKVASHDTLGRGKNRAPLDHIKLTNGRQPSVPFQKPEWDAVVFP